MLTVLATYHFEDVPHHVAIGGAPALRPVPRSGREGWIKLGTFLWIHTSGWRIDKCPHQTALWPYVAAMPSQRRTLVTPSGRGFSRLAEAQEAVEAVVARAQAGGAT